MLAFFLLFDDWDLPEPVRLPYHLMQGDCLDRMASIPDGSVDMVLCDLPYGTTACKWDSVIPFEPLWAHYRRVCKKNAALSVKPDISLQLVVCAANRHRETGKIICGARHCDAIMRQHLMAGERLYGWDQGFIDQWGQFLTREEAWLVAVRQNQIRRQIDTPEGTLYSEHLY